WTPIELQIGDNFAQSVAGYKQYDALLVNPVFDGLNLVSKEAPLVNCRDGVLILSENAGSHEELGEWVLTVNPFDVYGQAQALHEALTMEPEERRRRIEALRAFVREHDLAERIAAQRADLDRVPARTAGEAYDSRHGDDLGRGARLRQSAGGRGGTRGRRRARGAGAVGRSGAAGALGRPARDGASRARARRRDRRLRRRGDEEAARRRSRASSIPRSTARRGSRARL